ncbi:hypothetical protein [Corynebacterium heidelbergense]|nr:hypothetical protein [Corynebacterium heidelbergense]
MSYRNGNYDNYDDQTRQLNMNDYQGGRSTYGNSSGDYYRDEDYGRSGDYGDYGSRDSRGQQGYQSYQQGYQPEYAAPAGNAGAPTPSATPPAAPKQSLIAGRFDTKKVIVNLVMLGLLSAVVTFALVYVVDLLVGLLPGMVSLGMGPAVMSGVIAGVLGVVAGLLYIPVAGTGNEHLFGVAVIALAVVAIVVWVVLGGLLNGDWRTLVTLTGIICTAATAYATPSRIESADVRGYAR